MTTSPALLLDQAPPTSSRKKGGKPGTGRHGKSVGTHILLAAVSLYFLLPMWWLIVAGTKSTQGLFAGTGGPLWFDRDFALFDNIAQLVTYNNGIYLRWLGNSFLYAMAGGVGATILAVLAGYAFAKYRFRGRAVSFMILLASVMVPATALVIPTYVLFNNLGLTNTIWAVILPSLLSPFGVYLMRVYVQDAIPDELLDAARVDGSGEFRTFATIALPLMRPAVVTVLLLSVVGGWNNYFLPLAMISDPTLLPVTVGLNAWQVQSNSATANSLIWNLVTSGSLISVIPLIIAFLMLQKYWQGGLSVGSLK
ncbi:ABC transporter permease [Arthrobacter sp. PGP41]|uniref:carbohydrate ABC transporter permease n=1 Tax=Arthrobacter sp. PGP41 TaxID=2079227 RepID=UPI000CDBD803|nr:carbohydrate ABC transporter permease [Arthrobacter sp. PGP41]AUZ36047.1 ABC transporter permease [Arthrobacter sp. PGP41]